jgi:hypothetical protein
MNLRKEDPLLAEFERSLERMLGNWTDRVEVPQYGRAKLLAAAKNIPEARKNLLRRFWESLPQYETKSEHMSVLIYMPQMSYMSALVHY